MKGCCQMEQELAEVPLALAHSSSFHVHLVPEIKPSIFQLMNSWHIIFAKSMVRQEYKTPDLVLTRQQASSSSIVKIQSRNCKIEMKNTWRYDLPLTKEVCMCERERERETGWSMIILHWWKKHVRGGERQSYGGHTVAVKVTCIRLSMNLLLNHLTSSPKSLEVVKICINICVWLLLVSTFITMPSSLSG